MIDDQESTLGKHVCAYDWAGKVCQPAARPYQSVSVSRVGHARGYGIGRRGKRANVWSPYAICDRIGRGTPCCDIAVGSHGLSCE